ncbi:MAG: peptidoglycan DD-metalloendopeptidase family protein [Pseudomonadota bacterium]
MGSRRTIQGLAAAAVLTLGACTGGSNNADIEYRGTNPGSRGLGESGVSGPGIRQYDGFQVAVARDGDTVARVADRIGLSAIELANFNGLRPDSALRVGDELALPPRPAGSASAGRAIPSAPSAAPAPQVSPGFEAPAPDVASDPIVAAAPPPERAFERTVVTDTPTAPVPGASDWSPSLAAAAIERATGIDENGNLAAPPSANDPLPQNPVDARDLRSPDLGQYQSPADSGLAAGAAPPAVDEVPQAAPSNRLDFADDFETAPPPSAPERTAAVDPEVATPVEPAPRRSASRLLRPVEGPVALGFRQSAGGPRNDGVDFAATPGSPVVAAADGEVALVSRALGGLGTIVLVRHADELITVYGRVDEVGVAKGDIVRRGQRLGVVATPDTQTEALMHFEVRQGANSVDPMPYIGG